ASAASEPDPPAAAATEWTDEPPPPAQGLPELSQLLQPALPETAQSAPLRAQVSLRMKATEVRALPILRFPPAARSPPGLLLSPCYPNRLLHGRSSGAIGSLHLHQSNWNGSFSL